MSVWVAGIGAAVAVGTAVYSGEQQKGAAKDAAGAQKQASLLQIGEQQREFDQVKQLLAPYVGAGNQALGAQLDLIGLNSPEAQQAAIDKLTIGPEYKSLVSEGENALLQNAAATGGLRGGNTQDALSRLRPQILSQLINKQFDRLSGISTSGQNAAAGVGTAAQHTGDNISNIYGQMGADQAGLALATGRANANTAADISGIITQFLNSHQF